MCFVFLPSGLLSVFGQHMEYIGNTLHTLCMAGDGKSGPVCADKVSNTNTSRWQHESHVHSRGS